MEKNTISYKSFEKSPIRSLKHNTYFHVYDKIFSGYRDKDITFVDVGVAAGGSLYMWRDFFGSNARIIDIEFNPEAKVLEKEGFEIFIGNQSDQFFWKDFYSKVGPIDILLDDGGHTYIQQIVTLESSIKNINNGGVIVTEDVHTSYLSGFGVRNLSLINYAKKKIDDINLRFSKFKDHGERDIFSLEFYESIVVFNIDRKICSIESKPMVNTNNSLHTATDFRYKDIKIRIKFIKDLIHNLKSYLVLRKFFKK